MKMDRFALFVFLSALLVGYFQDAHCRVSSLTRTENLVTLNDESGLSKITEDRRAPRQKRVAVAAAGAAALNVLGFAVGVVGLALTIQSLIEARRAPQPSVEVIRELGEIRSMLRDMNYQFNEHHERVQNVLDSIENYHDLTRIFAVYSDDILRVKYFASFTENDALYRNTTNQIVVGSQISDWADAVLSESDDGIGPALFNIHHMVTGFNGLKPVLEVYLRGLMAPLRAEIWQELDVLVKSLVEIQKLGYEHWQIALDITGRSGEKSSNVREKFSSRLTTQLTRYLKIDERIKAWPQGQYGLVQAVTGCPTGQWSTGMRFHDTENVNPANGWSPRIEDFIKGSFRKDDMQWEFCMKRSTTLNDIDVEWPQGKYCVFADSDTCPPDFQLGWLIMDDEDTNNRNRRSGSLPAGYFTADTGYLFCCRQDGNVTDEIVLPVTKPFVLFPLHWNPCQAVRSMDVTDVYFHWDCQDSDKFAASAFRHWPHPTDTDPSNNILIHMCHYKLKLGSNILN